jgi:hypothetical protein
VLELGQEEVRHDPADERSAAPDIAALAGHVPSGGVEHLGCEVDHGNFCNVLFLSVSDGLYLWDEENLRKLHGRHQCSKHGDTQQTLLQ